MTRARRDASAVPTIGELIHEHMDRTGHSLRDLARESEHRLSHQSWGNLANGSFADFPRPDTVRVISETLGLAHTDVVLGFAAALGLHVRQPGAPIPLPAGVEDLDSSQRRMVFQLVLHPVCANDEQLWPC